MCQYGQQTIKGQQTSCIQCLSHTTNDPASSYHQHSQLCFLVNLQSTGCMSVAVPWCSRGTWHCVEGLIKRDKGNLGDVLLLCPTKDFFFFLVFGQVSPQIHIQLFKLVLWLPGKLWALRNLENYIGSWNWETNYISCLWTYCTYM